MSQPIDYNFARTNSFKLGAFLVDALKDLLCGILMDSNEEVKDGMSIKANIASPLGSLCGGCLDELRYSLITPVSYLLRRPYIASCIDVNPCMDYVEDLKIEIDCLVTSQRFCTVGFGPKP